MKIFTGFTHLSNSIVKIVISLIIIFNTSGAYAQNRQVIKGCLLEMKTNEPVPFAGVALNNFYDSTLVNGSISDEAGLFKIENVPAGRYRLSITFIGYESFEKDIELRKGETDLGVIYLKDSYLLLGETEVVGERSKAKSENGKTTFFMTPKMLAASSTGTDMLKQIPGISVDMMQNISLEGSSNILIYVNGIIRDRSYISQLDPGLIDKVELISAPSSNHDGSITGAINIILKREKDAGLSGQVYAEIPVSSGEVFIFPSYNFRYGAGKLNVFTSYNGEMTYLDLREETIRKVWVDDDTIKLNSLQVLRQKDWSHKFHYGFDYFITPNDVINFYAFCNPFSRELDGSAETNLSGYNASKSVAVKEDTDRNTSTSYSIYYKHKFNKEGQEISVDFSNYNLKAENSTKYIYESGTGSTTQTTNIIKPKQNATVLRIDFTNPVGKKFNISTGVKVKMQDLKDENSTELSYSDNVFAAYSSLLFKGERFDLSVGLRAEQAMTSNKDCPVKSFLNMLPYANLNYKTSKGGNIQITYSTSVKRPNLYQLNPYISVDDPYSTSMGNLLLEPEQRNNIYVEYSRQFSSNYFSARLFYKRNYNVIDNLVRISEDCEMKSQTENAGTLFNYGFQFTGTYKLGILTLSPYLQVFRQQTKINDIACSYLISDRQNVAFESGLSSILSFKHELSVSFNLQYSSPHYGIQDNTYSDPLYFVSIDKVFRQKIKVGITSGIPFTRSFVYNASETKGTNYSNRYEGTVNMSVIPFWFKVSYQFQAGKSRNKIDRVKEEIETLPKKGF
jgi:hypothetical protein